MSRMMQPRILGPVVIAVGLMVLGRIFFPAPLPHIQLPAETLLVLPGNFGFTNTMLAILTTDVLLILLALLVRRRLDMVPSGLQNVFEAVIEFWQDQAIQLVGPDLARRWLPLALTMFLLVGLANWSELVPGYDTVGIACSEDCPHVEGAPAETHTHFTGSSWGPFFLAMARDEGQRSEPESAQSTAPSLVAGTAHAQEDAPAEGEPAHGGSMAVVPFYRAASTDLNFTLALALIAFTVVQVAGFQALGVGGYLGKFFNIKEGVLGAFVGVVEFISELSRIISFSFRLFGNIFAGQVLLFVIPFLVPFLVPLVPLALETFVGLIQGYVFAILTLAFMAGAVTPHHHADDHH